MLTIVCNFHGVLERLCDVRKVWSKRKLIDNVRKVHRFKVTKVSSWRFRLRENRTFMIHMHMTSVPMTECCDMQVRYANRSGGVESPLDAHSPVAFFTFRVPYTRHAFPSGTKLYVGRNVAFFLLKMVSNMPRDFFDCLTI